MQALDVMYHNEFVCIVNDLFGCLFCLSHGWCLHMLISADAITYELCLTSFQLGSAFCYVLSASYHQVTAAKCNHYNYSSVTSVYVWLPIVP